MPLSRAASVLPRHALSLSLSLTTRLSLDVAATAEEVEKAMYDACKEASGTEKEFTFANDMVSPKVSLFTAAIEAAYEPKRAPGRLTAPAVVV